VPGTGVWLLGRGQQIPLPPARMSVGLDALVMSTGMLRRLTNRRFIIIIIIIIINVSSHSKFRQWGPGQSPGKFGFWSIFEPQKSRQNGMSDNALFDTAPVCRK